MKKQKIKVPYHGEEVRSLIKVVRNKCNKRIQVYDFLGYPKEMKSIPLYYSDTKKYCFPKKYYDEEEVLKVKKELEKVIKKNNWDINVEYEDHYWIGGLHCYGYKLKLRIA